MKMSKKRTVQLPKFLREEKWGVVEYVDDKVQEVKSLEDLIPEDDEDKSGLTLTIGERCRSTYADGEDYIASVVFLSEKKDVCLKWLQVESKKGVAVSVQKKVAKQNQKEKKKVPENKVKKQKPVAQPKKEVSKKASVVQKESRVAAATLTAQNLIKRMMHGNVSPDSVQQTNIDSQPTPLSTKPPTSYSPVNMLAGDTTIMTSMNTKHLDQFNSLVSAPINVLAGETAMSSMNTQPYNQMTNMNTQPFNYMPSIHTQPSHQMSITNTQPYNQISSINTQPSHQMSITNTQSPHQISSINTKPSNQMSITNTQSPHKISSLNTQPSNQMPGMKTQSFEQFNSPLSAPLNVLAGEATMSTPQIFNVSSIDNISHPISNQSYLSMMYSNDSTQTNDQFTMNALPRPQFVANPVFPLARNLSDSYPPFHKDHFNISSNSNMYCIDNLTSPEPVQSSPKECQKYQSTNMHNCNNCSLVNKRNEALITENNMLKSDLSHLKKKYEEAMKGKQDLARTGEESDPVYTPTRGYRSAKADYVIIPIEEGVKPGFERFGGSSSKVVVSSRWIGKLNAKTKKSTPACKLKRYFDGFFSPWDLQGMNSTKVGQLQGDKREIFLALETFASSECGLSSSEFNKCVNTKAGTAKRAMHIVYPEHAVPKKEKPVKRVKTNDLHCDLDVTPPFSPTSTRL